MTETMRILRDLSDSEVKALAREIRKRILPANRIECENGFLTLSKMHIAYGCTMVGPKEPNVIVCDPGMAMLAANKLVESRHGCGYLIPTGVAFVSGLQFMNAKFFADYEWPSHELLLMNIEASNENDPRLHAMITNAKS